MPRVKENITVPYDLEGFMSRCGITATQLARLWGKTLPTILAWKSSGQVSPMVRFAAIATEDLIARKRAATARQEVVDDE